jgi:hemoglobin/transferrin/lactoferrin receptor protein
MSRVALMLAIVTAGYAGAAGAQNAENDKDKPASKAAEEITVTATRFERLIDLTPQSVTVLDSEAIHAKSMANVQSILDDVPGVSMQRVGGLDGQMVVRGLSSNDGRIVMFVDGDRFRGRPFLEYSLLDPNEIERIEIIRGPAAALYGSDAMNGVVNVITRRAEGDPTQPFTLRPRLYAVGYSSADQLGAGRLEVQGVGNGFDILVGANYRSAGNFRSPLGEVPNSDFTARSLNVRMGYSPTAVGRFEVIAKLSSVDAGRANAPGPPLVTIREDPLRERHLRLAFTQSQVASWLQDVDLSLYTRKLSSVLRNVTRTAANGNVEFRDNWVVGPLELGGKVLARSIAGNSVLSYGLDFFHEDAPGLEDEVRIVNRAGATTVFDARAKRVRDAKQTNVGALARYDLDPSPRWTLSLGGRYDVIRTNFESTPAPREAAAVTAVYAENLSARDNALTGSAGMIFRPLPALHLVANVGTAFRHPTPNDKSGTGQQGALVTVPNPGLQPESSVSYEGGVRLRLQTLNVNLTAFRSDYQDLLQLTFLNPTTRKRVNVGEATVEGFEIDGAYAMTKALGWRFNAAQARGTNTITNAPLPAVPPLNGLLALRHTWPDYWLELAGRWSRDKTRIDPTQERPTDGYQTLSVYGGTDLARWVPLLKSYRLTVGIENLADEVYVNPATRELIGFPRTGTNPVVEPGRSLTINLTAEF